MTASRSEEEGETRAKAFLNLSDSRVSEVQTTGRSWPIRNLERSVENDPVALFSPDLFSTTSEVASYPAVPAAIRVFVSGNEAGTGRGPSFIGEGPR